MQRFALARLTLRSATVSKVGQALAASAHLPACSVAAPTLPVNLVSKRFFSKQIKEKDDLSTLLTNEIDYEETNYATNHETVDITKKIEKHFKIATTKGSPHVTLTRKYKDEDIKIVFNCQNINEDVADDYEEDAEGEEEQQEEEEEEEEEDDVEEESPLAIDFEVTVSKGANKLVAYCTATHDDIYFRNLRQVPVDVPNNSTEVYEGPNLEDLDEKLLASIYSYFMKRGIDNDLSYFIVAYSSDKEQKEYVNWLHGVRDFVSA